MSKRLLPQAAEGANRNGKGNESVSVDPPPDSYIHAVRLRILRGESVELPFPAESEEPSNVHSIEAARTRRATREALRRHGEL
jgi:hypothetical protein